MWLIGGIKKLILMQWQNKQLEYISFTLHCLVSFHLQKIRVSHRIHGVGACQCAYVHTDRIEKANQIRPIDVQGVISLKNVLHRSDSKLLNFSCIPHYIYICMCYYYFFIFRRSFYYCWKCFAFVFGVL